MQISARLVGVKPDKSEEELLHRQSEAGKEPGDLHVVFDYIKGNLGVLGMFCSLRGADVVCSAPRGALTRDVIAEVQRVFVEALTRI